MNKMRRNLIKIISCAIFSWFNRSDRFSVTLRPINVLVVDWLIRKYETFSLVKSFCLRNKVKLAYDLKLLSCNVIIQVPFSAAVIVLYRLTDSRRANRA